VVSAYNPGWTEPRIGEIFCKPPAPFLTASSSSGVKRFLMVGGAGSLFVAPGVQLGGYP